MDPGEIVLLYNPVANPVAFPSSKQFDEVRRRIDQQPEPVREPLDVDEAPFIGRPPPP